MIKKTVKYNDFDGNEHVEDFYFNLSKSELIGLEYSENGFGELLQEIVDTQDNREMFEKFKMILRKAYGIRSEDGKRFIKSEKISEEFEQTAAYDEIFFGIATNAEAASEFINAIMPAELADINLEDMSSEEKRKAALEKMQGHMKPKAKEQSSIEKVEELVVEGTVEEEDLSKLSHEELVARLAAK